MQESNFMETGSGGEGGEIGFGPVHFCDLPEGCIATVLSLTNPRDVCRLTSVSTVFKSAAESDAVWERFLPAEYQSMISRSLSCSSKKELYLSLCDNPVLIDDGKKCFSLDKRSGKKCYMLSARDLLIVWSDTPIYWRWTSLPGTRFEEGAELISVCWFDIRGKINTRMLSPETLYAAYLVFRSTGAYGFEWQPVEVTVGLVGSEGCKRTVNLDAERVRRQRYQTVPRRGLFNRSRIFGVQVSVPTREEDDGQYPKERRDGWLEIELGEFFNKGDVDGELEMSLLETKGGNWKGGLIVLGIEIRPIEGK